MSRLPIRVRLTAAFALAFVAVLAGAGLFVYERLRADLDEGVDETLQARAAAAAAGPRLPVLEVPDESVVAILRADGRALARTGRAREPLLTDAELRRAALAAVRVERRVAGLDGSVRLLAQPAPDGRVVVAGQSLDDRDEALAGVVTSFVAGGIVALVLASLLGYALAAAGLAPVEAMRRRAANVSLANGDERLPLPAAQDEIRRLGETLNEMLARLERAFERERRFVADASHELRTPIAVVKTELEGALLAGECGPRARAGVVAAIEECDRLAALADDLLVLAQAAEGRLPVRLEPLDAHTLLAEVRDEFADRAARHGRRITIEAGGQAALDGDPRRLRQALGNLVDNALRHGAGDIVLAAHDGTLEVRDAGPGIPPELAGRAFERFARGENARSRDAGAGLGLAIVQAVAEAHGGDAQIVAGDGACVRLTLSHDRLIGQA